MFFKYPEIVGFWYVNWNWPEKSNYLNPSYATAFASWGDSRIEMNAVVAAYFKENIAKVLASRNGTTQPSPIKYDTVVVKVPYPFYTTKKVVTYQQRVVIDTVESVVPDTITLYKDSVVIKPRAAALRATPKSSAISKIAPLKLNGFEVDGSEYWYHPEYVKTYPELPDRSAPPEAYMVHQWVTDKGTFKPITVK